MERLKFTREFKLEAVRLIKERGVSYVQASQDLACIRRSCAIARDLRLPGQRQLLAHRHSIPTRSL